LEAPLRIHEFFLQSVFYLYPSEVAARKGEQSGGSGFFVLVQSIAFPAVGYLYAVTNKHVVEDGKSRTIRINAKDGGIDTIQTQVEGWARPSTDDLAVTLVSTEENIHIHSYINEDAFLTKEIVEQMKIGPGDEVFLAGRFVTHEGRQSNTPSVRFGNIAMMPDEPVKRLDGVMQESFLVDVRSVSGYSGSPAFVYIPASEAPYRRVKQQGMGLGPWLLGVDWGHLPIWRDLVHKGDKETKHPEAWGINSNSGMAGIIPAWKLSQLLHSEDLELQRKQLDENQKRTE
jgi:hypothetical protein